MEQILIFRLITFFFLDTIAVRISQVANVADTPGAARAWSQSGTTHRLPFLVAFLVTAQTISAV